MRKVRDTVTIRSWNDMEKEFGLIKGGYIDTTPPFVPYMKECCEKTFMVKAVDMETGYYKLQGMYNFVFTEDMFERKFDITKDLVEGDGIKEKFINKNIIAYKANNKEEISFILKALEQLGYSCCVNMCFEFFIFIVVSKDKKTVNFANNIDFTPMSLENFIIAVQSPAETEYYYKEFIEAMEELAIEYINGTHKYNFNTCKLCKIVKSKGFNPDRTKGNCKICPNVVISGYACSMGKDAKDLDRAKELLEWIEIYKKKLAEENVNS